jgi:hypothetical protein
MFAAEEPVISVLTKTKIVFLPYFSFRKTGL